MKNTTKIGEVSTIQVCAALVKYGAQIWVPLGEGRRADLIVELSDRPSKVQCKTGRLQNGCVIFKTRSVHKKNGGGGYEQRGYSGQIDFFGVYCPDNEKCYLVPISITRNGSCSLRIQKPITHKSRVRWAEQFEINKNFSAGVVQ